MKRIITMIAVLLTLMITGQTTKEILDLGLKHLEITDAFIRIKQISPKKIEEAESKGFDLKGHIIGTRDGNQFTLEISRLGKSEKIYVITHELAHLEQIYSGDLTYLSGNSIEYKGTVYKNIERIDYRRRPWEHDANKRGKELYRLVADGLKQKKLESKLSK